MTHDAATPGAHDHASTLFLPRTDFPLRGCLPEREPALLERWRDVDLLGRMAARGRGRPRFVVHDGPPYANGHVHLGHALNKVLKDVVARSRRMSGWTSDLVPGWDCHGLPVEWKVERIYADEGRAKDDVPTVEFRRRCRAFAAGWVDVQRDELRRLGVSADWDRPYLTMTHAAEAMTARELLRLRDAGLLHLGSKPVMWSVAERTALAEAEVEYADVTDVTAHVAFPCSAVPDGGAPDGPAARWNALASDDGAGPAAVACWTTTPWTLPANRAVAFSPDVRYGAYRVTAAPDGGVARPGTRLVLADALADAVMAAAGVTGHERLRDVGADELGVGACSHPLRDLAGGYGFEVPLLAGGHVTDAAGTGLVHTAPGHGAEDHELWASSSGELAARGVDARVPHVVGPDGAYTDEAPGFAGSRVLLDDGSKGDGEAKVLAALERAGTLLARGCVRHPVPHSWRSGRRVLLRNTPQWFALLDRGYDAPGAEGRTLREVATEAVDGVRWSPPAARSRLAGMLASRPDWVLSRQRAWGVPLCLFVRTGADGLPEVLRDPGVDARVLDAFAAEGADAWYAEGARERFLGARASEAWDKVDDVLDVWFDSGCTHAFVLEDGEAFPFFADLRRARDGGRDVVMYLEGSDQHRGWFQSSLLESCATRGRAPYDVVLTHGFALDAKGRKMAKGLGNGVSPQDVVAADGADVLRLWVAMADHSGDVRVGSEAHAGARDAYRRLRNVLRWMLGALSHRAPGDEVDLADAPALERVVLHGLVVLDRTVREAYDAFDLAKVTSSLVAFVTDLSSSYVDARKDVLYCDPRSSPVRRAALATVEAAFERLVAWLAPVLPFTAEEAWLSRHPSADGSVHLLDFPVTPQGWEDPALDAAWSRVRQVRRVVTGALEVERRAGRLRSSLEAAPHVHVADDALLAALDGFDLAEVCVTSDLVLVHGAAPEDAFALPDVPGVTVVPDRAEGRRCARSWKVSPLVGTDPDFPDVTPRDARALRELAG